MKRSSYTEETIESARLYAKIVDKSFSNDKKMVKFFVNEREKNPNFARNMEVVNVLSNKQFMNFRVPLYTKIVGKNFLNDVEMAKFFISEREENPNFARNMQVMEVLTNKEFVSFRVPLYAKIAGKNFSNDVEMAKFFINEREESPNFRKNIQAMQYLIEDKKIKNVDELTNEKIEEARDIGNSRNLERELQEKYGFNKGYIAEGPYHASLNVVLTPAINHYNELSIEEKNHILGKYDMIGGTFTLSENKDGNLQVDIKMEKDVEKQVEVSHKKSSKMQGLYDDMPEDVKKSYDDMMKKSFTKDLDKLTNGEVAYLNAFFKDWCKDIEPEKMDVEDAKVYAIYTKVKNRYNKLVKQFGNIEISDDDQSIKKVNDVICAKIR